MAEIGRDILVNPELLVDSSFSEARREHADLLKGTSEAQRLEIEAEVSNLRSSAIAQVEELARVFGSTCEAKDLGALTDLSESLRDQYKLIAANIGVDRDLTKIAQEILDSYSSRADRNDFPRHLARITMPTGTAFLQVVHALNVYAEERSLGPLIARSDFGDNRWMDIQEEIPFRVEPGKAQHVQKLTGSVWQSWSSCFEKYGRGAPVGIIALVDACERISNGGRYGIIDRNRRSSEVLRGSKMEYALHFVSGRGVMLYDLDPRVGTDGCYFVKDLTKKNPFKS